MTERAGAPPSRPAGPGPGRSGERTILRSSLPFLFAVLFWASFHPMNLGFLAWVCLVPLLAYAKLTSGKTSFFVTWCASAIAFTACFSWIRPTVPWGHYVVGPYMGFYVAVFVLVIRRLGPLWTPVAWVALEYVRGYLFTGLPWFLLGYTQHELPHVIQIADLGGVWLVSGLVAFVNAAILERRRAPRFAAAFLVMAAFLYGAIRLSSIPILEGPKVGVIQPNVAQDLKLAAADPKRGEELAARAYQRHLALTKDIAVERPDLIIWPETAVYFGLLWRLDRNEWVRSDPWYDRVVAPSRDASTRMLIGLLVIEGEPRSTRRVATNSALYIDETGTIRERYDKVHLVPFAEYVPLASVLPWMPDLFETLSGLKLDDLRPGDGFPVWLLGGWRFGTQICFEGAFPDISREIAKKGASFAVNISNDGWFGSSAELDQMLAMARFRAIENRIHMIRATNTGISAFIDPTGRVQGWIPGKEVQGALVVKLRITDASSLFRMWGNWIGWSALLAAVAQLVRSASRRPGVSYRSPRSGRRRRPRTA